MNNPCLPSNAIFHLNENLVVVHDLGQNLYFYWWVDGWVSVGGRVGGEMEIKSTSAFNLKLKLKLGLEIMCAVLKGNKHDGMCCKYGLILSFVVPKQL